jgi:hypothetical protein
MQKPVSIQSTKDKPCQLLFEAVGYLAVSPAVCNARGTVTVAASDSKPQPRTRHWLCASSTASLRLLEDGGELFLSMGSSGVQYVRCVLLCRGPSGSINVGVDQPRILTPQETCSCWCLTSMSPNVRSPGLSGQGGGFCSGWGSDNLLNLENQYDLRKIKSLNKHLPLPRRL